MRECGREIKSPLGELRATRYSLSWQVLNERKGPIVVMKASSGSVCSGGSEPVLDLRPLRWSGQFLAAWRDIRWAFSLFPLALSLGWLDIKLRYRGSVLGPFWLTISTIVMVGALGVLYARLLHMDLRGFLPFLSLSLVLWGYISTLANEGPGTFVQQTALIHSARMPVSGHVLRAIIRNLLVLAHNIVVIVIVFAIFHVVPRHGLLILPALVLWLADSAALTLLLGLIGARFRDIPPLVAALMQILFFVTPIIWRPELLQGSRHILLFDPFYPLIECVREPLLGALPSRTIWEAALLHSVLLWSVTLVLFARFRARVAYWV